MGENGAGNLSAVLTREQQLAMLRRPETGIDDFVATKQLLKSTGMYDATIDALMKNANTTLSRVQGEIEDIRKTGGAKDIAKVLSKRLGHRPKVKT